jgi:serine/threonine protein phosphatase 1
MRRFAISDIHGCAKSFKALLNQIQLTNKDELYLLGDYIDRGPDSKGVLDLIFELQNNNFQVKCLKGNHEDMLLKGLHDHEQRYMWKVNGGKMALESFGANEVIDIPSKYLDFLKGLDYYFDLDDYLLIHAGLDFNMPNPLDGKYSLLWKRGWYRDIDYEWLGDQIVIHGHTPISRKLIETDVQRLKETQVLNIDAGCFLSYASDKGYLCAFEMNSKQLYFQDNVDDMNAYYGIIRND